MHLYSHVRAVQLNARVEQMHALFMRTADAADVAQKCKCTHLSHEQRLQQVADEAEFTQRKVYHVCAQISM